MLNPSLQALSLNAKNIQDALGTLARKLRKKAQEEVCGKLVSFRIDIAIRLDREILGANILLTDNGKYVLQTLAINELAHRHIAEYIILWPRV